MRAWHSTCLPASRVASVRVRCIYGHVPITTASTPSSSINSTQSPYGLGISNSSATRWLDSRLRFATATISHPAIRRRAGSITLRTFAPAPMIPTRIVACADRLLVALSEPNSVAPAAATSGRAPTERNSRRFSPPVAWLSNPSLIFVSAPVALVESRMNARNREGRHRDQRTGGSSRTQDSRLRSVTAPDGVASEPERFIIVTNWFEELRQRMGSN